MSHGLINHTFLQLLRNYDICVDYNKTSESIVFVGKKTQHIEHTFIFVHILYILHIKKYKF